jgi:hypothetical protein
MWFRSRWGNPWGFESPRSHFPERDAYHAGRVFQVTYSDGGLWRY